MLLALLIFLGANQGVIVAQPLVINSLALGAVLTSIDSDHCGKQETDKQKYIVSGK